MLIHRKEVVSKVDDQLVIIKGFRHNNLYMVEFT
jgi:hypothetical protein